MRALDSDGLILISAPSLTSYDLAQIISSLNHWASLPIKGINKNQLTGLLGGLPKKTSTKD
jgi:hypothetical protein